MTIAEQLNTKQGDDFGLKEKIVFHKILIWVTEWNNN